MKKSKFRQNMVVRIILLLLLSSRILGQSVDSNSVYFVTHIKATDFSVHFFDHRENLETVFNSFIEKDSLKLFRLFEGGDCNSLKEVPKMERRKILGFPDLNFGTVKIYNSFYLDVFKSERIKFVAQANDGLSDSVIMDANGVDFEHYIDHEFYKRNFSFEDISSLDIIGKEGIPLYISFTLRNSYLNLEKVYSRFKDFEFDEQTENVFLSLLMRKNKEMGVVLCPNFTPSQNVK
ncbi:MAG: hypothetical protein EP338_00020 [Bacteroidetes bacterium]|nr:MAG: hypothetical protein EP338_00020 [Bacteroidota bacterium]